jgi:hypothetical protein
MQTVSALIDFLMSLMRDDDTKAAFEKDPQATLKANGLEGITGDDVRDARLIMADNGDVRATGHGSGPGGSDPVREIHHTTRTYEVTEHNSVTNVDQTFNLLSIDDRDTVISDSFNKGDVENNVVAIQDNDTTNNDTTNTDIDVLDIDVTNPPGGGTESPTEPTPEPGLEVIQLPAAEPEPGLEEEPAVTEEPEPEPIVADEPDVPADDQPDLDAAVI